jgi:hypothetical protein
MSGHSPKPGLYPNRSTKSCRKLASSAPPATRTKRLGRVGIGRLLLCLRRTRVPLFDLGRCRATRPNQGCTQTVRQRAVASSRLRAGRTGAGPPPSLRFSTSRNSHQAAWPGRDRSPPSLPPTNPNQGCTQTVRQRAVASSRLRAGRTGALSSRCGRFGVWASGPTSTSATPIRAYIMSSRR